MAAGCIMLARLKTLAKQRTSFAFETTLASRSAIDLDVAFLRRLGAEPRVVAHQLEPGAVQVYDSESWERLTAEAGL